MSSFETYHSKHLKWQKELLELRALLLETELEETIKWGAPVYSLAGKNIVGLAAFKNHYGLWFFQGVFLADHKKLLVNANEEKTKALRQMRFEAGNKLPLDDIKAYVLEAIENQKQGRELKPQKTKAINITAELSDCFKADADFKAAFEKLSMGKQKDYANHIAEAKREATKKSRLAKIKPMIHEGIGLYDKYKNC